MNSDDLKPITQRVLLFVGISFTTLFLFTFFLFWISIDPPPPHPPERIGIAVSDAPTNSSYLGNPETFERGEPIFKIIQVEGNQINWTNYKITAQLENCENFYVMEVISIHHYSESVDSLNISVVGDTTYIGIYFIRDNNQLRKGDTAELRIFKDSNVIWQSPKPIVLD